jgi:hypothetical protein
MAMTRCGAEANLLLGFGPDLIAHLSKRRLSSGASFFGMACVAYVGTGIARMGSFVAAIKIDKICNGGEWVQALGL